MKLNYFILATIFTITGCEKHDDARLSLANEMQKICLAYDESEEFCRCVKADILQNTSLTYDMAESILSGQKQPFFYQMVFGAKIRCLCRVYPYQTEQKIQNARKQAQQILGIDDDSYPKMDCSLVKKINY